MRDKLVHLAGKAFTPSAVICDEPLIYGCGTKKVNIVQPTKPAATISQRKRMTAETSFFKASGPMGWSVLQTSK
jgi:hypothetical protein